MTETLILEERAGPCATLTLNRPDARNPLSWDLVGELAARLGDLTLDDDVRGVVLTGAGKAFSAGGDLKAQAQRQAWPVPERVARQQQVVEQLKRIWSFPKPLVAAVNGVAAGAGAGLALLCDVRYVSDAGRFAFPFPKVGLGPDYGVSWTLPRLVGQGAAARIMLTAAEVGADEALALGLAERVCAPDALLDEARGFVDDVAALAPFGVALAKQALRRSSALGFEAAIDAEFGSQHLAMTTEDHVGALAAFADKRAPTFANR